jgi:hypothetical protein
MEVHILKSFLQFTRTSSPAAATGTEIAVQYAWNSVLSILIHFSSR